ncbi:MAG: SDR family NAD(P)-dependent oxidoreductase [Elusimicrobia bacterium]|nr:SDR family NAD(P)-dependent oxidoreductase [Candidatus Obscuribacterium magneticum]
MSTRTLVTGGTGFIGSAIVKRLVAEGFAVKSLDNDSRGSREALAEVRDKVELVEGDIRNPDLVKKAARGVEAVVHLAFINGTEFFYQKPELVLDVAVRGMLNVLDACRENGIKELILASSSEVYQTPTKVPTDESVPLVVPDVLNPRYSYGGGKIISELLAINYGRKDFKRVLIFRPHNVYGPRMGHEHVLPQFILRALKAIQETPAGPVPFPIQGDGSQTRSFIHIDDFVEGFMCLLKKGEHLNIYNIGNPEEIAIKDVARQVVAYFGREAKVVPQEAPPGGTPRRCPDISKLKKLGFKPRISFAQGLPSIAAWYKAHAAMNQTV